VALTRAAVDAWADASGVELLFADGFDAALVGIGQRFNSYFLVYDRATVIQTMMDRDGMSEEDALEFFDFNIVGAWVGDATPCFLTTALEEAG
jgi:hypothetical protein